MGASKLKQLVYMCARVLDFHYGVLSVIGLESVGKTTLLYRLKLGESIKATPTIGKNMFKRGELGSASHLPIKPRHISVPVLMQDMDF